MPAKSAIEAKGLLPLVGKISDEELAEKAGLHKETVRIFRLRRRIPAIWAGETKVEDGSTSVRPLLSVRAAAQAKDLTAPAAPGPAVATPQAAAQPKAKVSTHVSAIVTAEDYDGRTTTNEGNAQNIITYMKRLPQQEFAAFIMKDAINRDADLKKSNAVRNWVLTDGKSLIL